MSTTCALCNQDPCLCTNSNMLPDFEKVSWGVITTPFLKSICLGVNCEIALFVCLECKTVFHLDNVHKHIHQHMGGVRASKEVKKQLTHIADGTGIDPNYPTWATELFGLPRPEMDSMTVKTELYGYPNCGLTSTTGAVKAHMKQPDNHPPCQQPILLDQLAQTLNNGATKVNLWIVPHAALLQPVPGHPSLLVQIHNFTWEEHRTGAVPNARMISPWLMGRVLRGLSAAHRGPAQSGRHAHGDRAWSTASCGQVVFSAGCWPLPRMNDRKNTQENLNIGSSPINHRTVSLVFGMCGETSTSGEVFSGEGDRLLAFDDGESQLRLNLRRGFQIRLWWVPSQMREEFG
ncbi:hypothetical protein B0H10DRAFT_1958839 [Mycena sp. CBHHK59/15]|nr:hypothetical protein B0H10DRAFT_1958839 [Mycena sp. CBHHK59/15]